MPLKLLQFGIPAIAALLVFEGGASAQQAPKGSTPPPSAGGSAAKTDDASRMAFLEAELDRAESASQRWFTGWTWGYAWLAAGQASLAVSAPNYDQRVGAGVGAGLSALGFLAMLSTPHTIVGAHDTLSRIDASTPFGLYQRRLRAEGILKASADEERFFHSWVTHVLDVAGSAGAFAVLLAGYKQPVYAWATLGAGIVLSEIQIWSRPFIATHAWKTYSDKYLPTSEGGMGWADFLLSLVVTPGGLAAQGTF
ncbi:MAG TPA: hypothetical protein VKU41_23765 [Polyangiaceae bacterium]|nr:hypothetical protein [Polyangiaceae bacterium]